MLLENKTGIHIELHAEDADTFSVYEREQQLRARRKFYLRSTILILILDLFILVATFAQLMTNNSVGITISGGIQLTVQGSIQSNAGTFVNNSGTIDLSGDWINSTGSNCFGASQGTVIMNGANQNITGSGSTQFNNLILAGSGTKTLFQNTTVGGLAGTGALDIGARTLDLNAHTLFVTNKTPAAITFSSGMMLSEKTDNSSNVNWSIGVMTGPHVIPFGNISGVQVPLTIDLTSGNIGNVTASTYATATDNTPYPSTPTLVTQVNDQAGFDNSANTVDRFWEIDNTGGTSPVFDLTFTYAPAESPANGNINLRAQRWNSPGYGWDLPLGGQSNPTTYSVHTPGVANYGAWTLAQEANPLPVTLLEFNAKANSKKQVDLTWTTISEINNDYFTVERSADGIRFDELEKIAGAGNSTLRLDYFTVDIHPNQGINYYRLKQTDYDGHYSYSETRTVLIHDGRGNVIVYPNPATTSTWILFDKLPENSGDIRFELMDAAGKKIAVKDLFELEAVSENSFRFDRGVLASGIYFYSLSSGGETICRGKITFD
jgi:hypothetical protein